LTKKVEKIFQPFKFVRSFNHSTIQNHSFKLVRSSFVRLVHSLRPFVQFVRSIYAYACALRACGACVCVFLYKTGGGSFLHPWRKPDQAGESSGKMLHTFRRTVRERIKKIEAKNGFLCVCIGVFEKKLKKINVTGFKMLAYIKYYP